MDKDVILMQWTTYYSAIKRNGILPFVATWMNLEIIVLNEIHQKQKDKYHMISVVCRI